jgi:hypothetical protein
MFKFYPVSRFLQFCCFFGCPCGFLTCSQACLLFFMPYAFPLFLFLSWYHSYFGMLIDNHFSWPFGQGKITGGEEVGVPSNADTISVSFIAVSRGCERCIIAESAMVWTRSDQVKFHFLISSSREIPGV